MPITAFFETDHGEKSYFQKNGNRPHAAFAHGLMEDFGYGMPRFGAEPLIISFSTAMRIAVRPDQSRTGREFVYCVEGKVAYTVATETYILEPGDSLLFEAYLPHHWKNLVTVPSRVLLVLCPMDGRDSPAERHFIK